MLVAIAIVSTVLLCETILRGDLTSAWRSLGVPAMLPGYGPYVTGNLLPSARFISRYPEPGATRGGMGLSYSPSRSKR
jgi:hypothetical protein